jgi:nucleotide-binding universal stress UspA family protein
MTIAAWDASPASEAALEWAARREAAGGRRLSVLRVVPPEGLTVAGPAPSLDVKAARGRLHRRLERLRRDHPGLEVEGGVAFGDTVDELRIATSEGNLLVVGQDRAHPDSPRERRRIASRLSSLARGTVVIVPLLAEEGEPSDPRTVVVGVDGTDASIGALRFAAEEARERGAVLLAAHVWAAPLVWDDVYVHSSELEALLVRQHAQLLEESIETGLGDYPDVRVVRRITRGDAALELPRLARGADLLVVGDHGRGRLARHLLGSVSSALTLDPSVATAIVHDPASTGREGASRGRGRVSA